MYQPWWLTDSYEGDFAIPVDFLTVSGAEGPALVRVWGDGKTDAGWGLTDKDDKPAFIPLYQRKRFQASAILAGYAEKIWAFAFIMRSMRVVCIDIDGKNGGFDHAASLGILPPTLAETSKSGDYGQSVFAGVELDGRRSIKKKMVRQRGYASTCKKHRKGRARVWRGICV